MLTYAQIKKGNKLHLVEVFPDGFMSLPLCGRSVERYRLTSNVPMGRACRNCRRVWEAGNARGDIGPLPWMEITVNVKSGKGD